MGFTKCKDLFWFFSCIMGKTEKYGWCFEKQNACWNGMGIPLFKPPPPPIMEEKMRCIIWPSITLKKRKRSNKSIKGNFDPFVMGPSNGMSKCTILTLEHTFEKQRVHGGCYVVGSKVFHGIESCERPIERGVNMYQNYISSYLPKNQFPFK